MLCEHTTIGRARHGGLVYPQKIVCGHESDIGRGLHVLNELVQNSVAALGILFRSGMWRLPLPARRVRSMREVHRVPELRVHKLVRVVVNADQASALRRKLGSDSVEGRIRGGIFSAGVKSG